jgi:hypothetical protein
MPPMQIVPLTADLNKPEIIDTTHAPSFEPTTEATKTESTTQGIRAARVQVEEEPATTEQAPIENTSVTICVEYNEIDDECSREEIMDNAAYDRHVEILNSHMKKVYEIEKVDLDTRVVLTKGRDCPSGYVKDAKSACRKSAVY